MKARLKIQKDHVVLYEHAYDISDAESFGKACSHAWVQLREQRLARATSIGALFEELDDQLLDELYGAKFSLLKE
jgi:hypothetical protein